MLYVLRLSFLKDCPLIFRAIEKNLRFQVQLLIRFCIFNIILLVTFTIAKTVFCALTVFGRSYSLRIKLNVKDVDFNPTSTFRPLSQHK